MQVTTISDLRKNAKKYFDQVVADKDILIISRGKGKSVVAMSMDRYNHMDTTDYLNSSKANREWLEKSMADIKAGRIIKKTAEELKAYEKT